MKFTAEIDKIEARKTASLDKLFKIVLVTDNPEVIELQKYIATSPVLVDVKEVE